MGHGFNDSDANYIKEKGVVYLDRLPHGKTFKMSEVQFYYEGPYDFESTFEKLSFDQENIKVRQVGTEQIFEMSADVQVYPVEET